MIRRIATVIAGVALGFVACRPGEGDYCKCPGECRRGLVCTQGGAVLDSCIPAGPGQEAGRCIEQDALPDMVGSLDETAAPEYHDVGGKRDFEPGTPSDEDTTAMTDPGSSSAGTSAGGTTGSGGTGTGSSTGPSTGTSSGTSTGSTGP